MSSSWIERFANPVRRLNFVRQRTAAHIAMQLRAMREDRGWSQSDVSAKSGIAQPVLSRCEKIGYGKYTVTTLLRLAEVFDVALDVSFVSYGELWKRERKLANEPLVPKGFSAELQARQHRDRKVVDLAKWLKVRDPELTTPLIGYEEETGQEAALQLNLIPGYSRHEVTAGGTYASYTA